jgi:hypothetical protein
LFWTIRSFKHDKPENLVLQLMKIISFFEKPVALTPQPRAANCLRKLYTLLVFHLYKSNSCQQKVTLCKIDHNAIITEGTTRARHLSAHNFFIIIIISMFKQWKLTISIKNLKTVGYHQVNERSPCLTFIISHLVLRTVTVFAFYVWIDFFSVSLLKLYCGEYLLLYSQFFYTLRACIILKMVLLRYRDQTVFLKEQVTSRRRYQRYLTIIKTQLNSFVWKETVSIKATISH